MKKYKKKQQQQLRSLKAVLPNLFLLIKAPKVLDTQVEYIPYKVGNEGMQLVNL